MVSENLKFDFVDGRLLKAEYRKVLPRHWPVEGSHVSSINIATENDQGRNRDEGDRHKVRKYLDPWDALFASGVGFADI